MEKEKKQKKFIEKAKEIHGDKYDYSKVKYTNVHKKVCIICPEHGEFWTTPANHCSKQNHCGCPKCKGKNLTTEEIKEKFKEVHGNRYDYSKVEYVNSQTKVCIICPKHGEFWQRPNDHIQGKGCHECSKDKLHDLFNIGTNNFIKKAKEIHGDKYDYSKVEYYNCKTKVCIICPKHGEFWQTPEAHLHGCGCLQCNNINKSVTILADLLKANNINFKREMCFDWLGRQRLDFYLPDYNIAIEYQGEQHFKPVKYFGGEKRFFDRIERDNRKKMLCDKNHVNLIYFSFLKNTPNNVINDFNKLILIIKNYDNN